MNMRPPITWKAACSSRTITFITRATKSTTAAVGITTFTWTAAIGSRTRLHHAGFKLTCSGPRRQCASISTTLPLNITLPSCANILEIGNPQKGDRMIIRMEMAIGATGQEIIRTDQKRIGTTQTAGTISLRI